MQNLLKNARICPEIARKVYEVYSRDAEVKPKHVQVKSRIVVKAPKKSIKETRDNLCWAIGEMVSTLEAEEYDQYLKTYLISEVRYFLDNRDKFGAEYCDCRVEPNMDYISKCFDEHARNSREEAKQILLFLQSKGNKAYLKGVVRKSYDDHYGLGDY